MSNVTNQSGFQICQINMVSEVNWVKLFLESTSSISVDTPQNGSTILNNIAYVVSRLMKEPKDHQVSTLLYCLGEEAKDILTSTNTIRYKILEGENFGKFGEL